MRSEQEINRAMELYANMIQRICLYHVKSKVDMEDIFQNVFLKYMMYKGSFRDEEHEKAWFIRVSINACKDHLKFLFRHKTISLDEINEQISHIKPEHKEVLQAVLSLPSKYKDTIYLYYYEGYSTKEIASILNVKENTVYSLLSRGRSLLKEKLGGDGFEE